MSQSIFTKVNVNLSSKRVAEMLGRAVDEGASCHWCEAIILSRKGMKVYRETGSAGLAMLHGFSVKCTEEFASFAKPGIILPEDIADKLQSIANDVPDVLAEILSSDFSSPFEGDWFLQELVFDANVSALSQSEYDMVIGDSLKILSMPADEDEDPEALDPIAQIHG